MEDEHWERRALVQRLTSLQLAGLQFVPKVDWLPPAPASHVATRHVAAVPVPSPAPTANIPPVAAPQIADAANSVRLPPSPTTDDTMAKTRTVAKPPGSEPAAGDNFQDLPRQTKDARTTALQVLKDEVQACRLCPALVKNRTQTVFGVGNLQPRLCFFGEAPGADEDREGEPFVGRAGQLLNDIISKGMGLQRSDIYILNVLKCRPPENRPPEEPEIANCRHFFERQLEVLRPEFICCLGATAAKALLNTTFSIGKLRGRFYEYRGAKVIATYHPAYLLRNPSAKKDVWEDIKLLMAEMKIDPPKR